MSDGILPHEFEVATADGHAYRLLARLPATPRRTLLWLPALGIAARHYVPFAEALAARGVAVFVHEWRGSGSSNLRADRAHDWGYRDVLVQDLPASSAAIDRVLPSGAPRLIGGHSLGGQLACCRLALAPGTADGLWLVASGAPYWRAFPRPHRLWLPFAYRFLPWLAQRRGYLPGRRLGFGGNEARSLIGDWARSAISGRYEAAGLDADLEAGMARLTLPVRALVLSDDWLTPASSTRFLLSKLPAADVLLAEFDRARAGTTPDHYAWMKQPSAVADWLCADGRADPQSGSRPAAA
ncbi:MAG: alpha/beta fold hydrolase [Luteimonas sp.]|nr:alpha/beta fold hydrolase [Luteimonas sp.]